MGLVSVKAQRSSISEIATSTRCGELYVSCISPRAARRCKETYYSPSSLSGPLDEPRRDQRVAKARASCDRDEVAVTRLMDRLVSQSRGPVCAVAMSGVVLCSRQGAYTHPISDVSPLPRSPAHRIPGKGRPRRAFLASQLRRNADICSGRS